MNLRRALAALVVGSAVAAAPTTCSVPAAAHAAEAGEHDAGWVRLTCAGTAADQRCHIRLPDGFRRLDVTYVHGGDELGTASTFTDQPGRPREAVRRTAGRVTRGVRAECEIVGAWASCTIHVRERVRDYRDTYWSSGSHQGGLIYDADGAPATS